VSEVERAKRVKVEEQSEQDKQLLNDRKDIAWLCMCLEQRKVMSPELETSPGTTWLTDFDAYVVAKKLLPTYSGVFEQDDPSIISVRVCYDQSDGDHSCRVAISKKRS
jgi:hypothetical protein